MSMPVHLFNKPIVGGNSGVVGDMSGNITSIPTILNETCTYNVHATFTGSPVGSIKLQGTNDPILLGWIDITGPGVTTVTPVTSAGTYMVNVEFAGYSQVQLIYTATSGSGTLYAQINAKRR
jgi:hypothetical protein